MKTMRHFFVLVLLGLLLSQPGWSAMHIYIKIDGVPGESVDVGHTNWIDAASIGFKTRMPEKPLGRLRHGFLRFTKEVDKASPILNRLVCDGSTTTSARVHLQRLSGVNPLYYKMIFSNVVFQMVETTTVSNEPVEFVMMDYDLFQWQYTEVSGASGPWMYGDPVNERSGYVTSNIDGDLLPAIIDPDDDNDGMSDKEEGLAGSSPLDPDDYFRVSFFQKSATNALLEWTSHSNRWYDILVSSDIEGPYVPSGLGPITDANEGGTVREVPLSPSRQFYQVVVQDPFPGWF